MLLEQERFMAIMNKVKRPGIEELLQHLEDETDFFEAPASTRFHLSHSGGLVEHSLNVYDCLKAKLESPFWGRRLKDIPEETLIICALLHDVCKADFYKEKADGYYVDEDFPIGHGEKSVILLQRYITLTDTEILAIRWHMGFSVDPSQYRSLGKAFELCPFIIALHEADNEAANIVEAGN